MFRGEISKMFTRYPLLSINGCMPIWFLSKSICSKLRFYFSWSLSYFVAVVSSKNREIFKESNLALCFSWFYYIFSSSFCCFFSQGMMKFSKGKSCITKINVLEQNRHQTPPAHHTTLLVLTLFILGCHSNPNKASHLDYNLVFRDLSDDNLFLLRFYGPVNPMRSCRVWSVYLTTLLYWAGLVLH